MVNGGEQVRGNFQVTIIEWQGNMTKSIAAVMTTILFMFINVSTSLAGTAADLLQRGTQVRKDFTGMRTEMLQDDIIRTVVILLSIFICITGVIFYLLRKKRTKKQSLGKAVGALQAPPPDNLLKNQEQPVNGVLSRGAAWWFYIALVLSAILHAFLVCFSSYGMLYEPAREFTMHLMIVLAGANGLIAVVLTLRRKILGIYWCVVPVALICLLVALQVDGLSSDDTIPMILLVLAPTAMLFSQMPSMRKLQKMGPGK
jgi:hypothetical protein